MKGFGISELAGRLGEWVQVERRGPERDALGGAAGAWSALGPSVAAAVVPEARGEAVAGGALSGLGWWRVTVRSPCAVAVGDRVAWRGRRLAVRRIEADPRLPDRIMFMTEETR